MHRFVRPILAFVASTVALVAQPATADDGRRHVMTPLQKIDLVRDLPDEPAFERDGQYFDLGYLYPIRTVNGASVASSGGEAGYVLYHDDKYMRVDSRLMADLRYALDDEDPTQGYTPPTPATSSQSTASADPWGANGNTDSARGQPVASLPARSSARRGGGIVATLFLLFVVLFLRIRAFRDLVIGGTLAAIAAIARGKADPDLGPTPTRPNDAAAQAATQRARLDALSGTSGAAPNTSSGGFGRKVV